MSSTHRLIAEIEEALADWNRWFGDEDIPSTAVMLGQSFMRGARLCELLDQCRAALIARDGIWQAFETPDGWPPETRDCDAVPDDEPAVLSDDDETAARASDGKGWAH